jgi:hypothetical protein
VLDFHAISMCLILLQSHFAGPLCNLAMSEASTISPSSTCFKYSFTVPASSEISLCLLYMQSHFACFLCNLTVPASYAISLCLLSILTVPGPYAISLSMLSMRYNLLCL